MTPQERDVIAGIFDRLKQAANQPRDPEAETFIAERLREQPYAPYAMAQAVYVQEQALANLNQQVESLQGELREAQPRASEAPKIHAIREQAAAVRFDRVVCCHVQLPPIVSLFRDDSRDRLRSRLEAWLKIWTGLHRPLTASAGRAHGYWPLISASDVRSATRVARVS